MQPKPKEAGAKGSGDNASQRESSVSSDDAKSNRSGGSLRAVNTASSVDNQLASAVSSQFLLPSSYEPSKTAPFEQLFLDHFIAAFDHRNLQGTPMRSWYDHLPAIYNTSPYQSCQDAARAAMMVYYGTMTSNPSIQTEAYRWYAKALESQRAFLQKDRLGLTKTMPAAEEILSPLILALFELVSPTTPTGWMDHIAGAATMLQMRKPENCQAGLAHLVFRTVRPTIVRAHGTTIHVTKFNVRQVYMTVATEEQHTFALPPWTTVPFGVHPKITYDKLLDILLLIPGCSSIKNRIQRLSSLDKSEEQKLRLELDLSASSLLQRLRNWWQEYADEQAKSGRDANSFGKLQPISMSNVPYFPDDFAAACTASYHTANIMLYSLLASCSGEASVHDAQIEWHSSHILESCSYMMANQTSSAGTVMMLFPLKIMWRSARNELQRQAAFEILEMWGRKKGIPAITTQLAPLYDIPIISASTISSHIPQYLHEE